MFIAYSIIFNKDVFWKMLNGQQLFCEKKLFWNVPQIYYKGTPSQVFPFEFFKNFRNSYSIKHLESTIFVKLKSLNSLIYWRQNEYLELTSKNPKLITVDDEASFCNVSYYSTDL